VTILLLAAVATLCHGAGDKDTWLAAKAAGAKHGVSATLLVSIRCHENPRRSADYKACGVKRGHGWAPGGLKGQMMACAKTVKHYAKSHSWDAHKLTKAQIRHLGQHYAEGSLAWGRSVWSLYRRMAPAH
jgi:hypothetical protein